MWASSLCNLTFQILRFWIFAKWWLGQKWGLTFSCVKGALAKIFDKKILCLKVEERLWFVIKYITLKQTPLILKTFPSECILNRVSLSIWLKANKYIHWVNDWKKNMDKQNSTLNLFSYLFIRRSRHDIHMFEQKFYMSKNLNFPTIINWNNVSITCMSIIIE